MRCFFRLVFLASTKSKSFTKNIVKAMIRLILFFITVLWIPRLCDMAAVNLASGDGHYYKIYHNNWELRPFEEIQYNGNHYEYVYNFAGRDHKVPLLYPNGTIIRNLTEAKTILDNEQSDKQKRKALAFHQKFAICVGGSVIVALACLGFILLLRAINLYRTWAFVLDAESFMKGYSSRKLLFKKLVSLPVLFLILLTILFIGPYIVIAAILTPVFGIMWIIHGKYFALEKFLLFCRTLGLDMTALEVDQLLGRNVSPESAETEGVNNLKDQESREQEDVIKVTRSQIDDYSFDRRSKYASPIKYLVPKKGFCEIRSFKSVCEKKHERIQVDNCVICLEMFDEDSKLFFLPCQHYFHSKCLGEARKSNLNGAFRCPLCNLSLLRYYVYFKEHKLDPTVVKFQYAE